MELKELFDLDDLAEVDFAEMMDQEVPCWSVAAVDGKNVPWCTKVATHWIRLSCRKCDKGTRLLTCQQCASTLSKMIWVLAMIFIMRKPKHDCRRPMTFHVRTGSLK